MGGGEELGMEIVIGVYYMKISLFPIKEKINAKVKHRLNLFAKCICDECLVFINKSYNSTIRITQLKK